MTRCLTRMIIFLTTTCAIAGNVPIRDYSFLYQDLPFAMDKVQQPSFPELQVCITEYGAKCDGVTSSTQAIAAAIDAVAQKGGGNGFDPGRTLDHRSDSAQEQHPSTCRQRGHRPVSRTTSMNSHW